MGLTIQSVGRQANDNFFTIQKKSPEDKVVAIAGNPNVGKSTIFNGLTNLHQHTGNWPGKTVANTQGYFSSKRHGYVMVDIPGTYSLMAHSPEEEVARNFLCFGGADAVIVVCDASCLERNLNLVLQTMEISRQVIVCVNLMDEAKRRHINVDLAELSRRLKVPVVGTAARDKKTLRALVELMDEAAEGQMEADYAFVPYAAPVEEAVAMLMPSLGKMTKEGMNPRWLGLRLLEGDESLDKELGFISSDQEVKEALERAGAYLESCGMGKENYEDAIVSGLLRRAEEICDGVVIRGCGARDRMEQKVDKILTGRLTGYPLMLALLAVVLWLTLAGANYPSRLMSEGLFWVQDRLAEGMIALGAPAWLLGMLVYGVYRVLAWVVSVMLPPMAIFFPLFTLLEDAGYLPRVAFNLDRPFQKCRACGKQGLSMCMGFGCNAAGVIGCRIIDSPRERLIAVLTNSFVPCNGRFPTLILLISIFFIGEASGFFGTAVSAVLLTLVILLGILMTFLVSRILSGTILKGIPSGFTLELPPYRRPQIGKVIVRSVFDRTLFVLGRAAAAAAPAGLLIWILSNVTTGQGNLLGTAAGFLDPFARLLGLDGVILLAFILGFPANEIVLPLILMIYLGQGQMMEPGSNDVIKGILAENGWTGVTAICTILFSLFHWPCSTTLWTVKKETGSVRFMILAAVLPTAAGILCCMLVNGAAALFL